MKKSFLVFILTLLNVNPSHASEGNTQIILEELLCNTTYESTVYHDGSKKNYYRTDDHPIQSASVKVLDIIKHPKHLFVKLNSPYTDETKKWMGIADLEKTTFEIRFNNLYQKSDYTGTDFTAFFGNMLVMKRKKLHISVTRADHDSVSMLFMKCKNL